MIVGSTDFRSEALDLNRVLSRACSELSSTAQRGFFPGRSIRLCGVVRGGDGGGGGSGQRDAGISLDFETPTTSRRWLCLGLSRARAPDLHSLFVFGCGVVACVAMRCGVKQGAPVSGTLFALCADGLLRRLGCVPPRRHFRLRR